MKKKTQKYIDDLHILLRELSMYQDAACWCGAQEEPGPPPARGWREGHTDLCRRIYRAMWGGP